MPSINVFTAVRSASMMAASTIDGKKTKTTAQEVSIEVCVTGGKRTDDPD
jgi:hypothetical protein